MTLQEKIAAARSVEGVHLTDSHHEFHSVGDLLVSRALEHSDRSFLVWRHGEARWEVSYGDLLDRVNATARFMLERGITRGSRIATIAHNHPDTVVQYFATWMLGAVLVPINAGEDDERIHYILENSEASLVFVRHEYRDRFEAIASGLQKRLIRVFSSASEAGLEAESYEREVEARLGLPLILPRTRMINDDALIVYTSGTTGAPKGVVLTHGNLLVDATGIATWHHVEERTRMMCVLPIHHVNGTVVTLLTPLMAGSSVVLNRKFSARDFFEVITQEDVSIVSMVPTLLAYLCSAHPKGRPVKAPSLRHVICGAGPLTCELAERFETLFDLPVIHGYGLSETTCYSCFLPVGQPDDERREWLTDYGFPSIGLAIPQNEMDVQTEQGESVPEGERGELVIRGHNVMKGYFNNPSANESTFLNAWFRSGDEGFYRTDSEGNRFFFITGRLKELIIRGGVNVSPLEIDEVLNSHPLVDAGIAVGFDNTWYGEEIGAFVRRDSDRLSEEELLAWCRERLPFHKQPKVVIFGDEIPVTSTGKYQRTRVKERFRDYREVQFRESSE